MDSPNQPHILLGDQLSTETRNERRTLLGASALGIVIVKTGLVPSKISALGIEFSQTDKRSLLLATAAIVIYFLIAFLIYALSDFLAWRLNIRESQRAGLKERTPSPLNPLNDFTEYARQRDENVEKRLPGRRWQTLSLPISILRAVLEFGVPILISGYAVFLLIRTGLTMPGS